MPRFTLILIAVTALLGAGVNGNVLGDQELDRQDQVRHTIKRSLPYLAEEGQWWIEDKNCVSCHRVAIMTWSLRIAATQGLSLDAGKLDGWTQWTLGRSLAKREKGKGLNGSSNLEGLAQILLGRDAKSADADRAKSYSRFVELIVKGQQADGSWKPAGQLPRQKRPKQETAAVSTMWIALALGSIDDAKGARSRDKAIDWLGKSNRGKSTEWYAVRLLLDLQIGDKDAIESSRKALVELQNQDGGFAWLIGDGSDALATGLSLYALRKSRMKPEEKAVQRAVDFLIKTQKDDGSWAVKGTKEKKKMKIEETASYWGTGWAVLGLSQVLTDSQ